MLLSPYLFMGWCKMEHTTMTQFIECSFLCLQLNIGTTEVPNQNHNIIVFLNHLLRNFKKSSEMARI